MFAKSVLISALFVALGFASPMELAERQTSCPNIHVFGARETTAPAGYGSAGTVVNLILNAHPGATSEAISYPACGGQSTCGGVSYANSAVQGVSAVASAVNSFNTRCPNTQLVLVGYSQGGQIMDDAFCGGGDTNEGLSSTAVPIQASAINQIKAAIFMGDPRYIYGLPYEVGTCRAQGYCCNGNDAATHQGYGSEYGQAALTFVNSKLSASSGSGTGSSTSVGGSAPTTSPSGGSVAEYGQCGGTGYTGATACASPYTCKVINSYYSQCL